MYYSTQAERQKVVDSLESAVNEIRFKQWLKDENLVSKNEREATNFALKCLLIATEEIKTRGTFTLLSEIVAKEHPKCKQIDIIKKDNELLKQTYKHLKSLLQEENQRFLNECRKNDIIIAEQSSELDRLKEQNNDEFTFTKNLLSVQIEENELKCKIEQNNLEQEINSIQERINQETKVHDEVMFYYDNEIKKVNELIAHWKDRYRDIEDRKSLLKSLLNDQREQHEELQFHKSLYTSRQTEIEEYLADKDRRRKEAEFELYRNQMATKIQSWWRGVMVRRYLGPFKHLLKLKNSKKRKMSIKKVMKK